MMLCPRHTFTVSVFNWIASLNSCFIHISSCSKNHLYQSLLSKIVVTHSYLIKSNTWQGSCQSLSFSSVIVLLFLVERVMFHGECHCFSEYFYLPFADLDSKIQIHMSVYKLISCQCISIIQIVINVYVPLSLLS